MGEFLVERSVLVDAGLEAVWSAVTDVAGWPEWKPFMRKASIAGGYDSLTCGSRIKMSVMIGGPASLPLNVTVTEFRRPNLLAWEGGAKGLFHAVHGFEFVDQGGKTLVTSREKFTGVLVPLAKLIVSGEDLENLHEQWVAAIKKRVEGKEEPAPADDHGH